MLYTPYEILQKVRIKAKQKRLSMDLSQKTLAQKSGVSYGTLKKFETTGQISFESLLKIVLILDKLDYFEQIFNISIQQVPLSLKKLLKEERQRGRK